jgi:2-methylisocitrate lyase-like PEP mutase family enzyme
MPAVRLPARYPGPPLPELAQLGVARVSLAGNLMRSALGHLRAIVQELRESGTYTRMNAEALSGSEFRSLFTI